jgi:glycine hydroxymethyltransferase
MVLEKASITANKNSLPGDVSAINPGGVRLGTPALTTRGLNEKDFDQVAEFLHRGCEIAIKAQHIAERNLAKQLEAGEIVRKTKKVLLKDFKQVVECDEDVKVEIEKLRQDVEDFATPFYMPGQL